MGNLDEFGLPIDDCECDCVGNVYNFNNCNLTIPESFGDALSYEQQILALEKHKQDKLIPGDNITITETEEGPVISASGEFESNSYTVTKNTDNLPENVTAEYNLVETHPDGTSENVGETISIPVIAGPEGPPGEPGRDGVSGTDGFSPTVTVSEIIDGHEVTITDKNGSHTFNVLNGQQGPAGEPGRDGVSGTDGTDGAAATVQIGNVETLPAGSSAYVRNEGNENAAVFDFGIPQGIQGPAGPSNVTAILTSGTEIADINGVKIYVPEVSEVTSESNIKIVTSTENYTLGSGMGQEAQFNSQYIADLPIDELKDGMVIILNRLGMDDTNASLQLRLNNNVVTEVIPIYKWSFNGLTRVKGYPSLKGPITLQYWSAGTLPYEINTLRPSPVVQYNSVDMFIVNTPCTSANLSGTKSVEAFTTRDKTRLSTGSLNLNVTSYSDNITIWERDGYYKVKGDIEFTSSVDVTITNNYLGLRFGYRSPTHSSSSDIPVFYVSCLVFIRTGSVGNYYSGMMEVSNYNTFLRIDNLPNEVISSGSYFKISL